MTNIPSHSNLQGATLLTGLALLFLIIPFYGYPNIGVPSLSIPYNTSAWSVASWIIAAALLLITINRQLVMPRLWFYFAIFPVLVIASSLFAGIDQPITWLFRILYIVAGLIFLIGLFQFQVKQSALDKILFVIVLAAGLQALLGLMQILYPEYIPSFFPKRGDIARGMFQQVNVFASFLTTGFVAAFYLISRPGFQFSLKAIRFSLIIVIPLILYVMVSTGSRVGLLALLLCAPLIILSRYKQLARYKKLLIILFILCSGSLWAAQAGLDRTIDKTAQLADKSYSSVRMKMYVIGLESIVSKPFYGHGIGGFLRAWNTQASEFVTQHPSVELPDYVTHPHNELLLWMIEGGLLVIAGIAAVIIGMILALYRCGFQRGGAYAAMMIPISLHTQVEYPFYVSSIHWFLWLFLLFLLLRHQTRLVTIPLSVIATRLIQFFAVSMAVGMTVFMVHTANAQSEIFKFIYGHKTPAPYMQTALHNIYSKPTAERIVMSSMLYASVKSGERAKVEMFEQWAQHYVMSKPELNIYGDLITASRFLRPQGKGCDAIKDALVVHAYNKSLQQVHQECSLK